MGMPTWDQFMIPVLRLQNDGETRHRRLIFELVADNEGLSVSQKEELLASGGPTYQNRIGWALSYLTNAGALSRPRRGEYAITQLGKQLLQHYPQGLSERELAEESGYDPRNHSSGKPTSTGRNTVVAQSPGQKTLGDDAESTLTQKLSPDELISAGEKEINSALGRELLTRLHQQDPFFFEQAVLRLLEAMGYGGTNGRILHTQLSHDGGIDGIIDQDALGLSRIHVQAKRYTLDKSIGRPDIQTFVGAMQGSQANQGVYITTAKYCDTAIKYAENVVPRVVLIDGEQLVNLMIHYGVGVQVRKTITLHEIDEDFFE